MTKLLPLDYNIPELVSSPPPFLPVPNKNKKNLKNDNYNSIIKRNSITFNGVVKNESKNNTNSNNNNSINDNHNNSNINNEEENEN